MQLLSFRYGKAWYHHRKAPDAKAGYLNFYGLQAEVVYEVVCNVEAQAVKKFVSNRVMSRQQLFFSDRIITESGQRSRILIANWLKTDNFWKADFKRDLQTRSDVNLPTIADSKNKIFDGDYLTGKWIKVRYISRGTKLF